MQHKNKDVLKFVRVLALMLALCTLFSFVSVFAGEARGVPAPVQSEEVEPGMGNSDAGTDEHEAEQPAADEPEPDGWKRAPASELPQREETENDESAPSHEKAQLVILGGLILQGDSLYAAENLVYCAMVLDGEIQITDQYKVQVADFGGYDVNVPGDYDVTFEAVLQTGEGEPPVTLTATSCFTVTSLDALVLSVGTQTFMAPAMVTPMAGGAVDIGFSFTPGTNPSGQPSGYNILAQVCDFHGYRNAQVAPKKGEMHFYGNTSNMFYRYHIETDQGYMVPMYCVEPNVQDKNPAGSWMGGAGWAYESVSNNNGTTGTFHNVEGSWAQANRDQRTAAAAISYFSRPEANIGAGQQQKIYETYYVAAQVLVWECLAGTVDTNPNSATYLEPLPNVSYYDRNLGGMTTGNYNNYEGSIFRACILGNNLPDLGYPTLEAYNKIKQRAKNYYALPTFMYARPESATVGTALYALPHPSLNQGRKFTDSPQMLATIDWNAVAQDQRLKVNTSTISQGYVTIQATGEIAKTTPAVASYAKAGTKNNKANAYFLSLYGNKYGYNGVDQGQTKLVSSSIDPSMAYMGFYTESAPMGQLVVAKYDKATNAIVPGETTFEIYAAEDIKIKGVIKWKSGSKIETLTTGRATKDRDANGNLTAADVTRADNGTALAAGVAVSSHLPFGKYRVVESVPPVGYTGGWEQAATVSSTTPVLRLSAHNVKQRIEVLKVDAKDSSIHLPGAAFNLFEKQVDGSWKLVDTIVTDNTGKAACDKIKNGWYRLTETEAPEGYATGWNKEFEVTQDDERIEFTATDQKQRVSVLKVDAEDDKKHLPGAEFDLFEQQADGSWQLVDRLTTDETGKARSDKVKNGHYKLVETKAPTGYVCNWEQEFDVTEEDECIELVAADKLMTGKILVNKIDASDGAPLAGVEFVVKNELGVIVETLATDENGSAVCTLPLGRYTVQETRGRQGYHLNTTVFEIEISEDGVLVPVTVRNDRMYGYVKFKMPNKRFPKTAVPEETITKEYEFTAESSENPAYDVPATIEQGGSTYELTDVSYTQVSQPLVETVILDGLAEEKAPDSYTVTREGSKVVLPLVEATYAAAPTMEHLTGTQDLGYSAAMPTAPEFSFFSVTDPDTGEQRDVELPLDSITMSKDFAWRNVDIDAVFFGSRDVYGFQLDSVTLPYREDSPVWEGFENAILAYLDLDARYYRITGARWTDGDFVTDASGTYRRAVFTAQHYTAHWTANYAGEVETGQEYVATAVYGNGQEGYGYVALATYTLKAVPERLGIPPVVAIIVGVVLLALLVAVVLAILAKKKKEKGETN